MIILAHGHFDLLHPGHFKHLKAAKDLGGFLIVSITAGRWMTKPGHPLYTDEERVLMLRELRCVDSVYICDDPGPYRAIDDINPDLYVKGIEYKGKLPEFQYCIDRGIGVRFLGEKIYGSTRIALQSGLLQGS